MRISKSLHFFASCGGVLREERKALRAHKRCCVGDCLTDYCCSNIIRAIDNPSTYSPYY